MVKMIFIVRMTGWFTVGLVKANARFFVVEIVVLSYGSGSSSLKKLIVKCTHNVLMVQPRRTHSFDSFKLYYNWK